MSGYVAFVYGSPDQNTNGNLVPGQLLDRATTAMHNIMIAGGNPEDWDLQKFFEGSLIEPGELPDEYQWRRQGSNDILRMLITRDGDDLTTEQAFAFSTDAGSNWTNIKKRTYTRLSDGVTSKTTWSLIT